MGCHAVMSGADPSPGIESRSRVKSEKEGREDDDEKEEEEDEDDEEELFPRARR